MNRIEARFSELKEQGKKGLVVYIGAGDPNLKATQELAIGFADSGVDILELGVPFSDPLADGIVNQLAAQRGLESGTTPGGVMQAVSQIRESSEIPILLYVYYNLIHQRGLDLFVADAAAAGVDGLLILDLPPEEGDAYHEAMMEAGLLPIYLIAPTTPEARIKFIASRAVGFIYYVSREGVTGMQSSVSETIEPMITLIRKYTDLPIAIGFGVSNPGQAKTVASFGEACVVGSAVVNRIAVLGDSPSLVSGVCGFVKTLSTALRAS
ncbi:MAG: Tryptophan synthase alpha chain [Verrucomicrobia subdivision 3 bacterium]|nr:Tryptophan synthase alpha chain [Limisphaerales bacterium]MCS1412806.1 Tryptophan synthase alpha chain [Limisphaerales bacterium]